MLRQLFSILFFLAISLSVYAVVADDKVELDVYWYKSDPFIYENESGELEGVEFDLMNAFVGFMNEKEESEVAINWIEATSFSNILEVVREKDNPDMIGVSAFSITESRLAYADFTQTYLSDVTVLISSEGTSIVSSFEEMYQMLNSMNAVTIRGTKYEEFLMDLKKQINVDFEIEFVENESDILDALNDNSNRFGFIDLPAYMMLIEEGGDVTRQNFFTRRGEGNAFILPKGSEWKSELDDFLQTNETEVANILTEYLGGELFDFINSLSSEDEIKTSLLTREKEMQVEMLKNVNLRLEQEQAVRRILIVSISVLVLLLVAFGYVFYRNQRNSTILLGQKDQIEDQQEDIRQKNEQLMNRNTQLVALNEEKNNLVKILAHDIRSPLSQIIMIVEIFDKNLDYDLTETEQKMLAQVTISAERINEMVTKILNVDALEENSIKVMNERVKIDTIMQDIAQRYRPVAAKKDIELSVVMCKEHNIIRTDHLLLLLVLENLVSNAVKFSGPKTTVSLIADCAYDSVVFKVADEGPGFSDDDKKKMFSRFQKLSAKPTAGESSTGLGLSIVKKYVQDLGGKLWVESEAGKGATFFVKFTA